MVNKCPVCKKPAISLKQRVINIINFSSNYNRDLECSNCKSKLKVNETYILPGAATIVFIPTLAGSFFDISDALLLLLTFSLCVSGYFLVPFEEIQADQTTNHNK